MRIQDYAIIGNCRSAALVSRSGSIDWLCWPRFDSPSIFAAILDDRGGRWSIAPAGPFESERSYEPGTNVLRTAFHTPSGTLILTDLMPVAAEQDKHRLLMPDQEVLRVAECTSGEVELEMLFEPRPDYGRAQVRLRDTGKLGLRVQRGAELLNLRATLPLEVGSDRASARTHLRAGQSVCASLTYCEDFPAVLPPLGEHSMKVLARSAAWWREWLSKMTYDGPWKEAVARSALTLKLLNYAPSGAILAAPTTSLPERIGGDLNWDYRFCWLRDASLTVRALFGLGFDDEAHAFLSWLLHSTKLTRPRLKMLYDVFGKLPGPETTLDHLSGYRDSRPVRVGNAAQAQRQLDVYGEVIDATTLFVERGGELDHETQRMLNAFGGYVVSNWSAPDEGMWEPRRTGRGPNTHSHVLCWAAMDRLIKMCEAGHLARAPVEAYRSAREAIRRAVETDAWNPELEAYAGRLRGGDLDAAVLLLPWYGFVRADAERMRKTYQRIREKLGAGGSLLYRYLREESPGEGAFGICSFWAVEYLALGGGTLEEAGAQLDELLEYSNDVGLYAEEIDPGTRDALGNFPQAFTHVGLINAALSIERRREDEQEIPRKTKSAPAKRKV